MRAVVCRKASRWGARRVGVVTVYTFGDSILDCGHYNAYGLHPAGLLVRNDDGLFPEFEGNDLSSEGVARLEHLAVDGARVDGLARQARGVRLAPDAVVMVTIGGNDLLGGLAVDKGPGIEDFRRKLSRFLEGMPRGRVLLGNVYDPSLGDDRRNFLPVDPALPRRNLARMNAALAELAAEHGELVDVHRHFLEKGDPSWFTMTIEPSLTGVSELRRCFLEPARRLARASAGGAAARDAASRTPRA